ncbi:MAG: MBL fold metallo-hydrolase, partial [Anaerolineae bacterium]
MDITYYGHNCFRMIERGMASIITDPFDASFASIDGPHLPADIVTISTNMPGHNGGAEVKGSPMVLNTPGEFEIGGVFITGIATWNPQTDPEHTHYNVAYVCDFDKVRVCHLGTLDYVPSQSVIEALGSVDVLMLP